MSIRPNDPLLTIARVMTAILMGITAFVAAALLVAVPVVFFKQPDFAQAVTEAGVGTVGMAMAATVALLILAASVCAIAFHFFQLLRRLINTVGKNDPFTLENADRLSRMGWIALTFQIASFPVAGLVAYLGHLVPAKNLSVDFDFSLTGVLLAVVLFILARVFRHGAAMREDLEGTV